MTKFAKLARWIISMHAEPPSVEDMIGSYPQYDKKEPVEIEEQEYEPNENELHWIDWAEKNGYTVQRTSNGIKIVK